MPRKGNQPPTPCPSAAAYWRHKDHGEEPCEGCWEAKREYDRAHRPAPTRYLGPGECGTKRGYRWHRKQNEQPCQACKDAVAADVRGRYGAATKHYPGRELAPCGTDAAYQRHLNHSEEPCQACKDAHTASARINNEADRIVAAMTRSAVS